LTFGISRVARTFMNKSTDSTTIPSWMIFDQLKGELTGVPPISEMNVEYLITFSISDGRFSVFDNI
jgi:hypothetical protein